MGSRTIHCALACHTVHNSIFGRSVAQHSANCKCNHSATAAALRPPAILQTGCRMSFAISCSPSGSMSVHKFTLLEACDSRHNRC